MFCPKCGIKNPDNGKYCRSCGANLSNVLAIVEGNLLPEQMPVAEENRAELFSTGVRNVILGFGFLAVGTFLFTMPPNDGIFWLLMMIPGFSLLASGVSRLIKADVLKKERTTRKNVIEPPTFPETRPNKELPPSQTDYVKPAKSIFATDDLSPEPLSVTENTTRHLEMKTKNETMTLPKK